MATSPIRGISLALLFLGGAHSWAQKGPSVDPELLDSLKIEANHNLERLKSLKEEKKNTRIYDEEREKSLGVYLEEQENWDLQRERGLAEYRKEKKNLSPSDDGPEYQEDQKEKRKQNEAAEKNREVQVNTRNAVTFKNPGVIADLEDQELDLTQKRPRYDLRKRGKNKWTKAKPGSTGGSSGGFGGDSSFPPPAPAPDYTPAPPPVDSYEDMPPPPPPPTYDYSNGAAMPYDSGYGDIPPPPPPPPVDYDF